jgi:hypothetical protein
MVLTELPWIFTTSLNVVVEGADYGFHVYPLGLVVVQLEKRGRERVDKDVSLRQLVRSLRPAEFVIEGSGVPRCQIAPS